MTSVNKGTQVRVWGLRDQLVVNTQCESLWPQASKLNHEICTKLRVCLALQRPAMWGCYTTQCDALSYEGCCQKFTLAHALLIWSQLEPLVVGRESTCWLTHAPVSNLAAVCGFFTNNAWKNESLSWNHDIHINTAADTVACMEYFLEGTTNYYCSGVFFIALYLRGLFQSTGLLPWIITQTW